MESWNPPRHLIKIRSSRHLSRVNKSTSILMVCLNLQNFLKSKVENFPIVEQIDGFELSLLCVCGVGGNEYQLFKYG